MLMFVVVFVIVVVIVAFVAEGVFGSSRGGVRFESVSGAQVFAFRRARQAPESNCYSGLSPMGNSVVLREITSIHGKRVCGAGQTGQTSDFVLCTGLYTLLLSHLLLPHLR